MGYPGEPFKKEFQSYNLDASADIIKRLNLRVQFCKDLIKVFTCLEVEKSYLKLIDWRLE